MIGFDDPGLMYMGRRNTSKQQTQEFWDSNPCGSSESWDHSKFIRYEYTDSYLRKYLTEEQFLGKKVLEIGCGQGLDASEIIKYCSLYNGVDLSIRSLLIANEECKKQNKAGVDLLFSAQDAELLSFKDETFDLVFSIGVLHHTNDFNKAIDEIYRILNKDGKLTLMLYKSYTPLWMIVRLVRGLLRFPVIGEDIKNWLIDTLREKKSKETDSLIGTALLELIGSPIINTFSVRDIESHFRNKFAISEVSSYRTGIDQLIRLLPSPLKKFWPTERISKFEKRFNKWLGFYMVIVAVKQ